MAHSVRACVSNLQQKLHQNKGACESLTPAVPDSPKLRPATIMTVLVESLWLVGDVCLISACMGGRQFVKRRGGGFVHVSHLPVTVCLPPSTPQAHNCNTFPLLSSSALPLAACPCGPCLQICLPACLEILAGFAQ